MCYTCFTYIHNAWFHVVSFNAVVHMPLKRHLLWHSKNIASELQYDCGCSCSITFLYNSCLVHVLRCTSHSIVTFVMLHIVAVVWRRRDGADSWEGMHAKSGSNDHIWITVCAPFYSICVVWCRAKHTDESMPFWLSGWWHKRRPPL